MGDCFFMKEQYEEAINCYDKAIVLDPNDPDLHSDKGLSLYQLSRFTEAIKSFNKAVDLDPKNRIYLKYREMAVKELSK
jgi:Flp pilus assembly protein TadD